MAAVDVSGEFETIAKLLAPLAHPEWGRGLVDDVAVVPSRPGFDLVMTKDALIEGVHFLAEDPLDTVAQKLLRVNLSDLAAKGVEPFGYLLACHWSQRCGWPERQAFAEGLARDQKDVRDRTCWAATRSSRPDRPPSRSPCWAGPRSGKVVARNGARPGDAVFVTGRIGDGWLGLKAAQGEPDALEPERIEALIDHYRRPMPQYGFRRGGSRHGDGVAGRLRRPDRRRRPYRRSLEASGSRSIWNAPPFPSPVSPGWRPGSTVRRPSNSWPRAATTMRSPSPPPPLTKPPCAARPSAAISA
jgi:hypothetical protein